VSPTSLIRLSSIPAWKTGRETAFSRNLRADANLCSTVGLGFSNLRLMRRCTNPQCSNATGWSLQAHGRISCLGVLGFQRCYLLIHFLDR
jgi:hypothetical protein